MLSFRPFRSSDFILFLRCYEDAPADNLGRMTPDRAMKESTLAGYANEKVTVPLTDTSQWMQTLVILSDGEPIGLNCARAVGKSLTVLNQSFVPEWRGRGLFDEMQTLLQLYAFETLEASEANFEIRKRSIPALAHVQNRDKYEHVDDEVSARTGELLHVGKITRSAWEKPTRSVPEPVPGRGADRAEDSSP